MRVIDKETGIVLVDNLMFADTFLKRFMGLMGKKSLPVGAGLKISPCNSIHTFFMKFPIDVIFVSKDDKVVKIVRNMMRRRVSPIIRNSQYVIECNGNSLPETINVGSKLKIIY